MSKIKYKEIKLSKKQAMEQKDIVEMLKTIKGTVVRKNILTGNVKVLVPESGPNPKLSGKDFTIETPYEISGIVYK